MRFSPLLLAPALSSALLLPPGLNHGKIQAENLEVTADSFSRLIRVPCDSCPYKDENVATDLVFDFSVAASDPTVMTLNGASVLPMALLNTPVLSAAQVPRDVETKTYLEDPSKFSTAQFDYNLMTHEAIVLTDGGYKHDTLELRISAVSGKPVRIHGVRVSVKEDLATGALIPAEVDLLPEGAAGCRNLKCIINTMMGHLRGHKKPCMEGKLGHHDGSRIGVTDLDGAVPPHHDHHDGPKLGHHRRPHYRHHHSVFRKVMHKVLLPILIGIAAGLAVSMFGLLVGHIAVMGYRKMRGEHMCRRRRDGKSCFGRRRRERMERRKQEGEADEAAKGLLTEEADVEAPPAYMDEGLEVVEKE